MTIDKDNLLSSIMESLDRVKYIRTGDIPAIDMYMDQVTTFMERKLRQTKRHAEDGKVLTKTMINNYAKNNLLPPPKGKKYTSDHVLLLIFIYYFKRILPIHDIQTLLGPLKDKFFHSKRSDEAAAEGESALAAIYEEVLQLEREQMQVLKEDIMSKFATSRATFAAADEEHGEYLRLFSFICMLSFDVYVKRLLIEKMVDMLGDGP